MSFRHVRVVLTGPEEKQSLFMNVAGDKSVSTENGNKEAVNTEKNRVYRRSQTVASLPKRDTNCWIRNTVTVDIKVRGAIARAVSCRFFTAEARVRSQSIRSGICGGCGNGKGSFSRVLRLSTASIISLCSSLNHASSGDGQRASYRPHFHAGTVSGQSDKKSIRKAATAPKHQLTDVYSGTKPATTTLYSE